MIEEVDHVTSKVRFKFLFINYYFLFSARNPRRQDFMGKTVSAEKLYMHPDYTTRYDWDFCLIKLSKALEFDCKVKPIGRVSKYNKKLYILKGKKSKNKYFYVYFQ